MLRLSTLVLATTLGLAGMPAHAPERAPAALRSEPFATVPPPASRQGDPADSLYKLAREHLNQGDDQQAAALFRSLVDRYPNSAYAPDALYWQAFALYRIGEPGELRRARAALAEQKQRYPKAATRGDAESLLTRINGKLARAGDSDAAESIAAEASAAAEAALAQVDVAGISAEATRVAMEAVKNVLPQAMDAARAGMEAARANMEASRAMTGHMHEALPPECAGQEEKNETRTAALNALMQMDAEQAVPVLRDVLKRRDVCSAPLRRHALMVVAQQHSPETEAILMDAVRNDPDARVRQTALMFLGSVHTPAALKAIEDILATSTDARVQETALVALSQQDSPEAAAALRRLATSENVRPELRMRAIFWFGQKGSPENAQFLRQLFRTTTDPTVKERALISLGQMPGEENARFLIDVAKDESEPANVRKQAVFWASQNHAISIADLARLYDSPIPKEMKEQVIFALGQRKDGVDKLLDIARNEKNPDFRRRAIFWLGQSRDPRVVKLLAELVNQ